MEPEATRTSLPEWERDIQPLGTRFFAAQFQRSLQGNAPSIWKLEVPDSSWLTPTWCAYGFVSRGMGGKA